MLAGVLSDISKIKIPAAGLQSSACGRSQVNAASLPYFLPA